MLNRHRDLVDWSIARATHVAIVVLLGLVVYAAYSPGVTGGFFYDDYSNLEKLEDVVDPESAAAFVIGGTAGPLGRPISLATFLPHAGGWPDNSSTILRVNVLIHVANAGLLFWIGYLILKLRGCVSSERAFWIALSASFLWAVMPIVASTTLIPIQRMTSLAAFFGLAGLVVFLYGYRWQASRPALAIFIQAVGLGGGTALGILSKESAALIPIFALLIDMVLLNGLKGSRRLIILRRMVLGSALVALVFYLSPLYRDWFYFDAYREFSPAERLLTQSAILWQYLQLTFLPQPTAFGPFHDHVEIYRHWSAPTIATLALGGLVVLALWLRKYSTWPLFAILWFLTGHLLESTTIMLELYFEHRNYLAVYGFALALSYLAWSAPGALARIGPALFGGYAAIMVGVLWMLTSIWGDPHGAAEVWSNKHPTSSRAALHLSTKDYELLGGSTYEANLELIGYARRAFANRGLDRVSEACPECIDTRLQALLYACGTEGASSVEERFKDLLGTAKHGRQTFVVPGGMFELRDAVNSGVCSPLERQDVRQLIDHVLINPAYRSPNHRTVLYFVLAALADDDGDREAVEANLALAEEIGPSALPVLEFQVHSLLAQGRNAEALQAIERRRPLIGKGRVTQITEEKLAELTNYLKTQPEGTPPQLQTYPF